MEQFFCTELLIGKEKLKKIQGSFAVVVGLGAVGSYALEALARAGVGRFRLVDFDTVKITNLNRHLLALHSTVGQEKVSLAKDRVSAINPKCKIEILRDFAAEESAEAIIRGGPDCVIDAIDSLNPKTQLLISCHKKNVKVVSSMGAALKTDPFLIRKGDISQVRNCRLADRLRKRLSNAGIREGILCVYSLEKARPVLDCAEMSLDEEVYVRGRRRKKLGSLPTIPGIFGLTVAHCALQILSDNA